MHGIPKLKGAEGETTVNRIYHLERGYENIVGKLGSVGADIRKA